MFLAMGPGGALAVKNEVLSRQGVMWYREISNQ
jgi:hypothetical protein